jgi:hypothetical protein
MFTLSFQTYQQKVSWSKRMLFGSLLIIIPDDFSDFMLATIVEGPDSKDKKKVSNDGRYECKVNMIESNYENF